MSKWLKQSTAASIVVGPFIAETDGYTSSESLTALSGIMFKHNAASTTINPTVGHTASGYYNLPLPSGSSDTVGTLRFAFSNSASHLPVWEDFMVVTASAYDGLIAGTDLIGAELAASGITASKFTAGAIDAATVAASTITTQKIGTGAIVNDNLEPGLITATEIGTGAIDADAIAASAITSAKIATDAIVIDVIAACAIGSSEIAATAADKIADHTMRREWGEAASSVDGDVKTGRSLLGAVAKLVNRIADSSGSLIVYEADDSTSLFTQDITADGTACPITELDTN